MRAENDYQQSPSQHDGAFVRKLATQVTGDETSIEPPQTVGTSHADMVLHTKSILDDSDHQVEERPVATALALSAEVREDPEYFTRSAIEEDEEEDDDTTEWESVPPRGLASCTICQDDLLFQDQLVDNLQLMTLCRHPLDFLSIFHNHDRKSGERNAVVDHASFYHIDSTCEYCGSASIRDCPAQCKRPRSFLAKKRPPFCKKGPTWDARSDDEIIIDDCLK
eukprot:scaffold2563_cov124-Cylindrotheca_fusiformis.AAC.21